MHLATYELLGINVPILLMSLLQGLAEVPLLRQSEALAALERRLLVLALG